MSVSYCLILSEGSFFSKGSIWYNFDSSPTNVQDSSEFMRAV